MPNGRFCILLVCTATQLPACQEEPPHSVHTHTHTAAAALRLAPRFGFRRCPLHQPHLISPRGARAYRTWSCRVEGQTLLLSHAAYERMVPVGRMVLLVIGGLVELAGGHNPKNTSQNPRRPEAQAALRQTLQGLMLTWHRLGDPMAILVPDQILMGDQLGRKTLQLPPGGR